MDFSNLEFKFVPKPDLLLIIVSGVLFITIFLPWWSWGGYTSFGYNYPGWSVNGFHNGGILTFMMCLVGIAASFLDSQKTRGIMGMGAGILAVLGTIISLATLSGAGIGFGMIIAIIASVALGVVGYMIYRKSQGLSTWGSSGGKTPPAQMPPSQTPPGQTPPPAGPSAPPPPPPPPPR
ncbi:MAG: hypothetical protein PHG35_05305 [Dehalococcoidales bacterium]|nr:hypothetical protein [Dehalococcoidales bacterium]